VLIGKVLSQKSENSSIEKALFVFKDFLMLLFFCNFHKNALDLDLQTYLDQNKIIKYHFPQISGVPKTRIMDICAGRCDISRCSVKKVQNWQKHLTLQWKIL